MAALERHVGLRFLPHLRPHRLRVVESKRQRVRPFKRHALAVHRLALVADQVRDFRGGGAGDGQSNQQSTREPA